MGIQEETGWRWLCCEGQGHTGCWRLLSNRSIEYETYAPVARLEAIRVFLAFTAHLIFKIYHIECEVFLPEWWVGGRVLMYNSPQTLEFQITWTLYIYSSRLSTGSSKLRTWYDTLSQLFLENHVVNCVIDKTLCSIMLKVYLMIE